MSLPPILPRCACTACLITTLAIAAGLPTAASHDSGCVSVTGGSVQTIRITVEDGPEDVRSGWSAGDADRLGSLVAFLPPSEDAGGAPCYALSTSIMVSSNVDYDLVVSGDALVPDVHLLGAVPSNYAACTGLEPVSVAMFPEAGPPAGWVLRHFPRTPRQVHPLSVSVVAGPGDDPLVLLTASHLTILVRASE